MMRHKDGLHFGSSTVDQDDEYIERHWRRMMLWLRGFLAAGLAICIAGAVIATRSGSGLFAGQFTATALIASGGLVWNIRHLRQRTAWTTPTP